MRVIYCAVLSLAIIATALGQRGGHGGGGFGHGGGGFSHGGGFGGGMHASGFARGGFSGPMRGGFGGGIGRGPGFSGPVRGGAGFRGGFHNGGFHNGFAFRRGFGFRRFNSPFFGFYGYPFYYPFADYGFGYGDPFWSDYYDNSTVSYPYYGYSGGAYAPSYGMYPPQQAPVVINQIGIPPVGPPPMVGPPPEAAAPEGAVCETCGAPGRRSGPVEYLIAFKDHNIKLALAYWTEKNELRYVTMDHEIKTVPLSSVDRDLSLQLNRERRVTFSLPVMATAGG